MPTPTSPRSRSSTATSARSQRSAGSHVRAFAALGGVPVGMIRYDNLTPAVIRVALGRERLQNPRFVALRSHYGYDSFFCIPGIEGAHEKGGSRERSAGSVDGT